MAEVLRGSTSTIGLVSVLQLCEAEALTGVLRVGDATLSFSNGQLVAARFGAVAGIDAVLEAMLHRGADFVFVDEPVERAASLGDLAPLLLEGCRLMDDWARVDQRILRPRGALPDRLARLAGELDGTRSVADAVTRSGVARVAVVDALVTALDGGVFEVLARPVGPALPDSFDDLLDFGRARARDGQLADARAAFEKALRVHPGDRVATQNLRRIVALQGS